MYTVLPKAAGNVYILNYSLLWISNVVTCLRLPAEVGAWIKKREKTISLSFRFFAVVCGFIFRTVLFADLSLKSFKLVLKCVPKCGGGVQQSSQPIISRKTVKEL